MSHHYRGVGAVPAVLLMERDHLLYLDIQSYQASTTGVYEDRVSLVTFAPYLKN